MPTQFSVTDQTPIAIPTLIQQEVVKEQPMFDKIVLKAGEDLPLDIEGKPIDLSGAIALTRNTKSDHWLHKLISIAQKVHRWLTGRKGDNKLAHGVIILDKDARPEKKNNLIISHAVFDGIRTASRDYLHEGNITEMYIYIPKDKHLRELIKTYGNQTAYVNEKHLPDGEKKKVLPPFSIKDMFRSLWHNKKPKACPRENIVKRTSFVVADLLLGNQILDKKNKPKAFFCTPYAATVLQGSVLINSLSKDQIDQIKNVDGKERSRDEIAATIHQKLFKHDTADSLSNTYWQNQLCKWDARFLMSSYASETLDRMSE